LENNTCYDQKFYIEESSEIYVTRGKFDRLKGGLDKMNKDINESNDKRDYVIQQKFEQP
jgi:hypothetical protein